MNGLRVYKRKIVKSDKMIPGTPCDTYVMHQMVGETKVDWRDGMRRLVEEGAVDDRA